jgi:hypothetical protein
MGVFLPLWVSITGKHSFRLSQHVTLLLTVNVHAWSKKAQTTVAHRTVKINCGMALQAIVPPEAFANWHRDMPLIQAQ